jgi:membrane-associated phospholipid phosphatase
MAPLQRIAAMDHALGRRIHAAANASSNLRTAATVASLSVDEAIWFTAPLLAALVCFLVETGTISPVLVSRESASEYRRYALELFNDAIMCTGGGALLKIPARRPRPPYATQSTYFITNGDLYSFPSGHSLYAALMFGRYTDRSLFGSSNVAVVIGTAAVAWSRAAKGRHFPLDTVCGAVIGGVISYLSRRGGLFTLTWARCKLVVALAQMSEVLLATALPRYQTPGYVLGSVFLALAFALLPFGQMPPLGDWSSLGLPIAALLLACPLVAEVGPRRRRIPPDTAAGAKVD